MIMTLFETTVPQSGREAFAAYLKPELARLLSAVGMDVVYTRGQGDYLYYQHADGTEREVLDMLGGFGTTLFGHNHPSLVGRAVDLLQADRPFASQGSMRSYAGLLAKRLSQMVGRTTGRHYMATLANSGAEAVEAALKHAELERSERLQLFLARLRRTFKAIRIALHGGTVIDPSGLNAEVARILGVPEIADLDALEYHLVQYNQRALSVDTRYLALEGAFHGKTTGALKLTHNPEYRNPWYRIGLQATFVPAEDAAALARALKDAETICYTVVLTENGEIRLEAQCWSQIVACLVEPIQGEGGIHELSTPFLHALRAAADEHGYPLIMDEIQSGMGRTGTFLASEPAEVRGDYYLFSKSLGGGLAKLSALLVQRERYIERFGYLHTSTFADDDFSCAVALAALDILEQDTGALMRGCGEKGTYLMGLLRELQARYPQVIKEVRGRGLMIGVEFHPPRDSASALLRVVAEQDLLGFLLSGYLLNVEGIRVAPTLSANNTMRVEPSAYVSYQDLDHFCQSLERVVEIIARADAHHLVRFMVGRYCDDGVSETAAHPVVESPIASHGARLAGRRVACVAHFIDSTDLLHWDATLAPLNPEECTALLERFSDVVDPFIVGEKVISSSQGERISLTVVGLPFTSAQVMERLRDGRTDMVVAEIEKAVELVKRLGCTQIGFAGYTSIATNNCLDLIEDRIGLTSGNSLTATAALEATHLAAQEMGIAVHSTRLGLVGGAGNIGRALAEIESDAVDSLVLVGRSGTRRRLVRLAESIYARAWERLLDGQIECGVARSLARTGIAEQLGKLPSDANIGAAIFRFFANQVGGAAPIQIADDLTALRDCNVIISATNAPQPIIGPEHIGPQPTLICDVSVPSDVDPELLVERPCARVIKGGIVRLPLGQDISIAGMDLPGGQFYACLSEVVLLGLANIQTHFSYGTLQSARMRQISQLARQHGFSVEIKSG
jgi:acetylornithine/succinyldiaminopimelate/putrescine aminotransferase/predicted amino acid dehydrogenase